MIFVTGPLFAGKQTYIQNALGWTGEEFAERGIRDVQELAAAAVSEQAPEGHDERMRRCERQKREAAGILSRLLAEQADLVIRVTCGLPQFLKGSGEDIDAYRRRHSEN